MVIDSTQKTTSTNVINQLASATIKLSVITKIHKYKGLNEGHHFISMAMEVHGALGHDMDRFIRECVCLFHDKRLGGHLSLCFCIQFFRQHANIYFQRTLTYIIERKIASTRNAYSRLPITIRSRDLHACNIRGAMGEIASYHKRV